MDKWNLLRFRSGWLMIILSLSMLIFSSDQVLTQTLVDPDRNKPSERRRPIIKNLRFEDGTLYLDAAGSFIDPQSATLKVNNREGFPLNFDDSGVYLRVSKDRSSSPGGVKISDAIPRGQTVIITVVNPNGDRSDPITFQR